MHVKNNLVGYLSPVEREAPKLPSLRQMSANNFGMKSATDKQETLHKGKSQ